MTTQPLARFSTTRLWILILSIIALTIGPTYLAAFSYWYGAAATYFIFGVIIFIVLLEMKDERVIKGLSLIAFGVIMQFIFALIFKDRAPAGMFSNNLDLFAQSILFACTGAGGSIIAVHADMYSSETKEPGSPSITDNTRHIEKLIAQTERLNKKINYLFGALTILALTTAISLITRG